MPFPNAKGFDPGLDDLWKVIEGPMQAGIAEKAARKKQEWELAKYGQERSDKKAATARAETRLAETKRHNTAMEDQASSNQEGLASYRDATLKNQERRLVMQVERILKGGKQDFELNRERHLGNINKELAIRSDAMLALANGDAAGAMETFNKLDPNVQAVDAHIENGDAVITLQDGKVHRFNLRSALAASSAARGNTRFYAGIRAGEAALLKAGLTPEQVRTVLDKVPIDGSAKVSRGKAGFQSEMAAKIKNGDEFTPGDIQVAETYGVTLPGVAASNEVFIPGAGRVKINRNKKTSSADLKALVDASEMAKKITRIAEEFKPEFVGSWFNVTGEANLAAQKRGLPIVDKPNGNVIWWQNYDEFVNDVRHELFGATLTKNEKKAFDKVIIQKSMDGPVAKASLERQMGIMYDALKREAVGRAMSSSRPDIIRNVIGDHLWLGLERRSASESFIARSKDGMSISNIGEQLSKEGYSDESILFAIKSNRK